MAGRQTFEDYRKYHFAQPNPDQSEVIDVSVEGYAFQAFRSTWDTFIDSQGNDCAVYFRCYR